MTAFLEVRDLKCHYPQHQQKINGHYPPVKAVDGVSFSLNAGEVLGIIGESGCGKSTLGRLLVQLDKPTGGEMLLDGQNAIDLCRKDAKAFRRTCQMVFQNPFDAFNPRFKLMKSMKRPLMVHGIGKDDAERTKLCVEILEAAGMRPALDYLDRFPHELSGGQLQRLSILRSMMLHPRLLVADEPVSMLDVSVRAEVMDLLEDLKARYHMSMVFISHDIATTRVIADKVAVMYLGHIVEIGETDEVIQSPCHPYTKALISNCGTLDTEGFHPIQISGEPPVPIGQAPGCGFAPRCWLTCPRCTEKDPVYTEVSPGHLVACACLDQMK